MTLCLAAAVCLLLWFSFGKAGAPTYEQVQTETRTICGQVDSESMPGKLLIVTNSGAIEIVSLPEVTSWVKVADCP